MAALVQTYPQQPSTVTMLQGRPSSVGSFSQQHSPPRAQMPRFPTSNSGSYRGLPSGLVAPYAFTSTPQLTNMPQPINNGASLQIASSPHLQTQSRTLSAPNILVGNQRAMSGASILSPQQRFATASSLSTSSSSSKSDQAGKRSMDDASTTTRETSVDVPARPKSAVGLSPFSSISSKPSPDRYRRGSRQPQADPNSNGSIINNNSGGTNKAQSATVSPNESSAPLRQVICDSGQQANRHFHQPLHTLRSERPGLPKNASTDDLTLVTPRSNVELAQRYRRRSVGSFEAVGDLSKPLSQPTSLPMRAPHVELRDRRHLPETQSPIFCHSRQDSSESVSSNRSARSVGPHSTRRDNVAAPKVAVAGSMHATSISKQEVRLVTVPPRPDAVKRLTSPSPLSKPSTIHDASLEAQAAGKNCVNQASATASLMSQESPAAQQLAAINKDAKKKSRLRKAFSFGSSSELRRASAQNISDRIPVPEPATKRNSKFDDEMDLAQAEIAQKQEAGGLGESIYSGQGNFFTGSTDNLSIQSSASSASVMLRRMGNGVKKSTRSIVGIFRPKSVTGVPAADGPVVGTAHVSMVTVEAERGKVNVNLNPHDQAGGGTGFPKLERNSLDATASVDTAASFNDTGPRRSIVGGERERAEVLAAVKKGILKRNDSSQSSPATTPSYRVPDFNLPPIPHVNDSPNPSEPSTPSDGAPARSGHRRTDSVTVEASDSDYFSSITQFAAFDAAGAPMTPQGSLARNISFSPCIQCHDTWASREYDRRGDIATCNRLTPMLAQQIKEELNTFKMEMEVHESSKMYTHFF